MLRRIRTALLTHFRALRPNVAPQWHTPGVISLWIYDMELSGVVFNDPILITAYEWAVGELYGVTFKDFWIHHDDAGYEGSGPTEVGLWQRMGDVEDNHRFAALIAEGKLHRVGTIPASALPRHLCHTSTIRG